MVGDNLAMEKVMVTITINRRNLFSTVAMHNVLPARLAVGAARWLIFAERFSDTERAKKERERKIIIIIIIRFY